MIWMILHVGLIVDVFLLLIVLFIISAHFEILFYNDYSWISYKLSKTL